MNGEICIQVFCYMNSDSFFGVLKGIVDNCDIVVVIEFQRCVKEYYVS